MPLQFTLPGFESALQPEPIYHVPRTEHWAPIAGWETFYEVSDRGRVRRTNAAGGTRVGRLLTHPRPAHNGYYMVTLSRSGLRRTYTIHRLVALAFVPVAHPETLWVNHINGNKLDNRVSNLEWVTQQENINHASRTGLLQSGADHWMHRNPNWRVGIQYPRAVMTEATVRETRALAAAGWKPIAIARHLGVSNVIIYQVLHGVSWRHVV